MSAKKAKAERRAAGYVKPAKVATPLHERTDLAPQVHLMPNGRLSRRMTRKQAEYLKSRVSVLPEGAVLGEIDLTIGQHDGKPIFEELAPAVEPPQELLEGTITTPDGVTHDLADLDWKRTD